MNHFCALQRNADKRWDYTYNSSPWGYCRVYKPIPEDGNVIPVKMARQENEKMTPLVGKFHSTGHETKEEACQCYKEYLLDTVLRLTTEEPKNANQQNKCQVCSKWTACHAYVGAYHLFVLCPEHQNRESVEKLLKIGESWES